MSEQKSQRKLKILTTAWEIITEHGAAGLNMKELAQIANVPRASLYRTYASKEHIISDITYEWGMSVVRRLEQESPRGKTNGERIKNVYKNILAEAENNPLLISAVLENLLSTDETTRNMQIQFEGLLPALLSSAIDCHAIPDTQQVMDVLLRLLLANLQMLSSGRSSFNEALSIMLYTSEKLMGKDFWCS